MRAQGRTCGSQVLAPAPALGYSAELGSISQARSANLVYGVPDPDYLGQFTRAGYLGTPGPQTAASCPLLGTATEVLAALLDWAPACESLMNASMDQVGLGFTQSSDSANTWVLTFGHS